MSCNITLFNFDATKEICITYPLLYLHGCIDSEEGKFVTCVNKTIIDQEHVEWPINEKEFKTFVHLKEGENEVCLISDSGDSLTLHVTHTKETNCRQVLIVYIICENSDGSFMAPPSVPNTSADAVMKIQLNARLIQTYFAESLYEHGFERKVFSYVEDEEKRPLVHIVHSKLNIEETKTMTRDELYDSFKKELELLLPVDPYRKLLCFMSCTRYNPPSDVKDITVEMIQSHVTGHAALGGGNMALFGTGSLHTWASELSELNAKFSDTTQIDRTKLFDDSAGRGTYMDNYSTTLGATVHELGHAFNLAHTKHGIMCRGHDDMNYFFTVVKPCSPSETTTVNTNINKLIDDTCKYKGAHWYRSSSIILNCHKWFNSRPTQVEDSLQKISKIVHPNLLGPLGNVGVWCQKDQISFNSKQWIDEEGLTLIGVILHHDDEYICGLQFIGAQYEIVDGHLQCTGEEKQSDIYGTSPESSTKIVFYFNEKDEKIIEIKVRSGAYIDGLEITTNTKCSGWVGGNGGDLTVYKVDNERFIEACVGTASEYVGSIGFLLNTSTDVEVHKDVVTFASPNGIRMIETYDEKNGEVSEFREYLNKPPVEAVQLLLTDLFVEDKTERVCGLVIDNVGEIMMFSIDQVELELISKID